MPTESDSAPQPPVKDERSHFMAHMGHDLRAPMTNILALTEALVDGVYGPLAPAQTETLKHIRDNGHRMINMVTDLVDIARFETGQNKLEPASCEIMEPCRNGMDMARGLAKSKKVTIASELVPPFVNAVADARRLRQMMAGIATATVVSAPADGHARFRVEARPTEGLVRIDALTSKRADQICPTDNSKKNSPGSPEALKRLRKMSSVAAAMVEKIVQLHGGAIAVTEHEAGNVAITVTLPLDFPESGAKPGTAVAATPEAAPSDGPAPIFILLADDEEIIRTITKDYLDSIGYRVVVVTNGREALDFLQSETPDLIIMDMQMPLLDGMEALLQLRRSTDARISNIPVISLSGVATPGHRERCLAAGANGCLAKPFGIKDLERVIKATLASSN